MLRRAVFPGSFDPLTVAHLAIADAVRHQLAVDTVDLVISHVALGKEDRASAVQDRVDAIRGFREHRPWLDATATRAQLLVDIAHGYDVLVLGADKWHQIHDVRFYGGSRRARDEALSRLPAVAIAPRAGSDVPAGDRVQLLRLPAEHREVSSTAVRAGREHWRA